MGYSPWGHKESDTAEWLSTHTGMTENSPVESTGVRVFMTLDLVKTCV